jgi:hypothetical protein
VFCGGFVEGVLVLEGLGFWLCDDWLIESLIDWRGSTAMLFS